MTPEAKEALQVAVFALGTAEGKIARATDDVIAADDLEQICRHFVEIREANEAIKGARKRLQAIEDKLSRETIPETLKRHGVKHIRLEDIGTFSVTHRYSCSMLDKTAGIEWLRDHNHEGLIQETVNSSTLAAFAKGLLIDEGKELPDNIFKVSIAPHTSVRR